MSKLRLTRKQLSTFLNDHELIKQFENLFGQVDNLSTNVLDYILISIGNAIAKAQESQDELQSLRNSIEGAALRPVEHQNNSITTDYIDLPIDGPHVTQERRLQWNTDDGTIDVGLFNGVVLQVGQETHFYAKNTSGVAISNGQSVMATGALGSSGKLTIAKAVADGSIVGDYMLGVATQNIGINAFGYVTGYGMVRGIDASGTPYGEAWADGDVLYFSSTVAGGLTKVQPSAPNLRSKMAMVINASAGGSGSIYVRAKTGETLTGLNDVYAPTPSNYEILQWNTANSRFEKTGIAVGLKYGGTATNYSFFEADGTLVFNGNATVWNDWNLTRDFTPNAGVGVPVRNALVGNIVKDQFAVNDALQYQSAELLHDWKEGTDMQVHIHWATGGLNNATVRGVKWEIEYTVCNILESAVAPYAYTAAVTQSLEFSIPAAQPDRTHRISTIYTIPASTLRIGAQLMIRLKRIASVTNVAPADDPFVISFGVHYEADTVGSRTVSAK